MPATLEALKERLGPERGPALLVTRNNLALARELEAATPRLDWTVISKDDLRDGGGVRGLVGRFRARTWRVLAIEDGAGDLARRREIYAALLVLGRARSRWLLATGEDGTTAEAVPRWRSAPRLIAELFAETAAAAGALAGARRLLGSFGRRPSPPAPPAPRGPGRVAFLKTDFWFGVKAGGSVSHTVGVLGGMRSLGLDCRMWTPTPFARLPGGVEQVETPPPPRPHLFEEAALAGFNRAFLRAALPGIRAFRPTVVYQRHSIFSLVGAAVSRALGIPLVLEVNASEVWARRAWSRLYFGRLAEAMERACFRRAHRLVLISEELIPTVRELGGDEKRMVVNPNGVDVTRFDPEAPREAVREALDLPPDAVLCGFIGTFTRWHGVLFLAEQIPALAAADPRLRFLFIGDGDLRPAVEAHLREAGAADRARFAGLRAPGEVPELLTACDILLSPHLPFEDGTPFFGSPTKLFEYLAAGRPVVASRLGQIGRVVEDGRTGILYPPGDGAAFRAAVGRLATDREARLRMGRAAREAAVTRYTWEANVRRALEGLVELPPPPGSPGDR